MFKTAIVTGGRKGIGRTVADVLQKQGYRVLLTGRGAYVPPNGMEYLICDNRDVEAIRRTVSHAEELLGRIDLLVNNAGVAPQQRQDLLETSEESFDFVLDTNLKGTFFFTQATANRMLRHVGEADYSPRIINISSVSAYAASLNRGEYCISKAGLHMINDLFALRLAEVGIPVFEIRPGIIETDMTAGVQEAYRTRISKGLTPIRRIGRPEDVADAVLAAASGRLDFATGQVLNVDGGFHLRQL